MFFIWLSLYSYSFPLPVTNLEPSHVEPLFPPVHWSFFLNTALFFPREAFPCLHWDVFDLGPGAVSLEPNTPLHSSRLLFPKNVTQIPSCHYTCEAKEIIHNLKTLPISSRRLLALRFSYGTLPLIIIWIYAWNLYVICIPCSGLDVLPPKGSSFSGSILPSIQLPIIEAQTLFDVGYTFPLFQEFSVLLNRAFMRKRKHPTSFMDQP